MNRASSILDHLGKSILKNVEEMGKITMLLLSALAWMVRPPLKARLIFKQMEFVGVKSIIVVLLTGTFTGMVMALQGYHGFRLFSAEGLVGSTVALGMTRELGPVLTALVVAGRVGAGITAELGSMQVTDQIDAMRAMATDPYKKLVVTRVIALVIMLPILVAVADVVGLFGGLIIAVTNLNVGLELYKSTVLSALLFEDLVSGFVKPIVFAVLIGTIGCFLGMRTSGGTKGVGS